MHTETQILRDLVVVLAAALPIVLVFQRLRFPTVVGFLIAGIFIGPHGVGVVADDADVRSLAEFGIVLLLFVVGLELSFRQLMRLGRLLFGSGIAQISMTVFAAALTARVAGLDMPAAVFIGFLIAHSSTAIALKLLADRGETDAPHGRIMIGLLLVQDLSLVPMALFTRLLAAPDSTSWGTVGVTLLVSAAALALMVIGAHLIMPAVLKLIVRLRSRELFTAAVVVLCLGTAWLAAEFGLSLALGALIAGLVISESEYSHQVIADVLPFRDVLNGVFFISVGMLLRLDYVTEHFVWILIGSGAVIAFKFAVLFATIWGFGGPARAAAISGLGLAGMGEMAFVLLSIGGPLNILAPETTEAIVALAVVTMLITPALLAIAPAVGDLLQTRFGGPTLDEAPVEQRSNHVIVLGYGLNGENVARVLRETAIAHVVVDLNPDLIAKARNNGDDVLFGDGTRIEVLLQAGLQTAAALVVAISDPVATRRIVGNARSEAPEIAIIVRTRYVAEVDELRRLGATEVIPEEFETSIEIFARVLDHLRVPRNIVNMQVMLIRGESYGLLRQTSKERGNLAHLDAILAAATIDNFMVTAESPIVGKTIAELNLRGATGVTIIAVVRGNTPRTNPPADMRIEAGDILVLFGSHAELDAATTVLQADHPRA
jgi:CPA2 family monovalent cation:H+ antiporter-2